MLPCGMNCLFHGSCIGSRSWGVESCTADELKAIAVIGFGYQYEDAEPFVEKLLDKLGELGIILPQQVYYIPGKEPHEMQNPASMRYMLDEVCVRLLTGRHAELSGRDMDKILVLALLPEGGDAGISTAYHVLKRRCEGDLGMISHACSLTKCYKHKDYLQNAALKIKAKLRQQAFWSSSPLQSVFAPEMAA